MLVRLPAPQPRAAAEARDHNTGVGMCRSLHDYLRRQSRESKRFFSALVKDPRVARLLNESITVARRWSEDRSADRSAFDRMKRFSLEHSPAVRRTRSAIWFRMLAGRSACIRIAARSVPDHRMLTKPSAELSLFDTLSQLDLLRAAKLLGPEGGRLITEGGQYDIDIATQVEFDRSRFRLAVDSATVTLALSPVARHRLEWHCSACETPCEHAGAAFSLILEEKLALGLTDEIGRAHV